MIFGIFENVAQFLEVLGVWLAASATFCAAYVALHVSNRANRQKLKVVAKPMIQVTRGIADSNVDIFSIQATNLGVRPVTIRALGFRSRYPRYDAVLMEGMSGSSPIPVTIGDGESANWIYHETRDDGENWYDGLAQHFKDYGALKRFLVCRNVRVFVATSHGKDFFAAKSTEFRKKVQSRLKELEKT